MKTWVQILIAMLLLCRSGQAQGFVNLDFESANVSGYSNNGFDFVPPANALPGWTGYLGTNQVTRVLFDDLTLGSASIDIFDTNSSLFGSSYVIQDHYSVVLQGGVYFNGQNDNDVSASITQTGLIPVSAISLLFEANTPSTDPLLVSLAGQNLNYFAISTEANYTLFGADISAFAGQMETLTFSSTSSIMGAAGYRLLDNIQFSSSPVPEPSALNLSALGGLFLAGLARLGKNFRVRRMN